MIKLVENIPLDTGVIADLISDRDDLNLVWPLAKFPFDHDQWREVLDPGAGNRPFLVCRDRQLIGHAALRVTDDAKTYMVSFLFLLPEIRSRGLGTRLIGLIEAYAQEKLHAGKLILVARTYNPRAVRCYAKSGFAEYDREGTLIRMQKMMHRR